MGSVYQFDMLLSNIGCMRKSVKWYKKLAFHFNDLTLLSGHALYSTNAGQETSLADFCLAVMNQMVEKFHTQKCKSKGGRSHSILADIQPLSFNSIGKWHLWSYHMEREGERIMLYVC
jgi:hypothetical protein